MKSFSGSAAIALQLSLLASLGWLPVACGGSSDGADPDAQAVTGGGSGAAAITGGSSGKGGTATSNDGPPCTSPTFNEVTGLTSCAENYSYRSKVVACAVRAGAPQVEAGAGGAGGTAGGSSVGGDAAAAGTSSGSGSGLSCGSDGSADCAATVPHGFCDFSGSMFAPDVCRSGCLNDSECGSDKLCSCGGDGAGVCVPARCREGSDCSPGLQCRMYGPPACGSGHSFACQRPVSAEDECLTDADCLPASFARGGTCGFDGKKSVCSPAVTCGRPFLVDAQARVASVVATGDWTTGGLASPRTEHLALSERAALAAHWSKLGQMEHASIAAFARFSLQLLSLGAPSELVDACTQALADETAHTRLCFKIASAYAGRALGPGPLDVDGSLGVTSLVDVTDLVIAEGCFGETSAALEALQSAESAEDPVIRAAYSQIAQDEQRHAELAFRYLGWALERGGAAVRERIELALLSSPERFAAREVVLPCLKALLAHSPSQAAA